MHNKENLLKELNDKYGVSIMPVENFDENNEYKRISDDDFAKLNAYFQGVPYHLKSIYDTKNYSGTYRAVYDKGLGILQKSSKDPSLFRGNIVAAGTNNEITGQSLFQEVNPEIRSLSNVVISSFTIASIATNQYFLARIDKKLESVENKVNEIKQLLEIEKESQLLADGEFLNEVSENIQYIIINEAYRTATLINVQSIRKTALANIKLFSKKLEFLKPELNLNSNDKFKEINEKLNKYKDYLPKYWYSVYLYGLAYSLEVYLSNITDTVFLKKVILEIEKIITIYQEGYEVIRDLVNQYIYEVNPLKTNGRTAKYAKNLGELITSPISNPLYRGVTDSFLDVGVERLEEREKNKKNAAKQKLMDELESKINPFSDLEPLKVQIEGLNTIDAVYNKRLELIITSTEAFIKCDYSRLD